MLGMLDKKDKLAALIVGGPKKEEEGYEESDMELSKEAKKDAARQFLAAIESKNIEALIDSFETFRECYESED